LLPALASAKNRAQMVVDLNNNKQILTATIMYSNDHGDTMPLLGSWNNATYVTWASGYPFNMGPCPPTLFSTIYGYEQNEYQGKGPLGNTKTIPCLLYPYIPVAGKTFLCPADVPNALYYQRGVFITSYVWNGAVAGYGGTGVPTVNTPIGKVTGSYKLSAFKPQYILMWENDETLPTQYWNDFSNYPDEGISRRHGKGATVGYFGGTSERMSLQKFYYWATDNGPFNSGRGYGKGQIMPNPLWCSPLHPALGY
jgi:hypothetical protein